MKAVALLAKGQIKCLILGAFGAQKIVNRINRGIRTPLSQSRSARPGMVGGVAEGAELRPGFKREFLMPHATVPAVLYPGDLRILHIGGLAIVSEDEGVYCQFSCSLFYFF